MSVEDLFHATAADDDDDATNNVSKADNPLRVAVEPCQNSLSIIIIIIVIRECITRLATSRLRNLQLQLAGCHARACNVGKFIFLHYAPQPKRTIIGSDIGALYFWSQSRRSCAFETCQAPLSSLVTKPIHFIGRARAWVDPMQNHRSQAHKMPIYKFYFHIPSK